MLRNTILTLTSFIFLMLTSLPCFAYIEDSVYFGGGVGYTRAFIDEDDTIPRASDIDDSDVGYKFLFGYQFSQNWAVELDYFNLNDIDYDFDFPKSTKSVRTQIGTLDIVGILPLSDRISGYLKLGIAQTFIDRDRDLRFRSSDRISSEFTGIYAVGLRYNFTPGWGIAIDYDQLFSEPHNLLVALTLSYYFNALP